MCCLLACGGGGDDDAQTSNGAQEAGTPAPVPAGSGGGGQAAPAGTGGSAAQPVQPRDSSTADAAAAADAASDAASDGGALPPAGIDCTPRTIAGGDATVHFHHVHFNTQHPEQDLELFEKLFATKTVEWCKDKRTAEATWATKTERGYFLYTQVEAAPDPALNTYLEHVGWIHPNPNMELLRLVALDAPLFPAVRAQCPEAFMGTMACGTGGYWFYLQAPSGARIEIAKGPGPATMGFGHVHLIMGADLTLIEKLTGGAYKDGAIDLVNHTVITLQESFLANETVVETRGKPIDHIAYSTTDLDAARARVLAAGVTLAEEVSWKPQFGFRSFFVKDAKGVWYELVEDSAFVP